MRDLLPTEIFASIESHLRSAASHGEDGWSAGEEEEDTVTGDFCSSLRTSWREHRVGPTSWRWRVSYKKFRSKGEGAEEKQLGADGIVQIEVKSEDTIRSKGMLFQAKMASNKDRRGLRSQCQRMESISDNCSAVFVYGARGYTAMPSAGYLKSSDSITQQASIGEFLATQFLPCNVGKRGLYYDAVRRQLLVPDVTAGVMQLQAHLKHRLRIEVVSPN